MTDHKKFLIISLITSFLYMLIGLVLMIVNQLDTVSVILFVAIILIGAVSNILTWKMMHDQNRGNK